MAAQTPLVGAVDADDVAWTVGDVLDFPASGLFTAQCGTEWVRVTAGAGTTAWTVTRGYNDTTPAAHDDGDAVSLVDDAYTSRLQILRRIPSIKEADYAWLDSAVDAANDWVSSELGFFYGPTADTSRTFDIPVSGDRLWIPGGIRSLTKVEVAQQTAGEFTEADLDDVLLRPRDWEKPPGAPYRELVIRDLATGPIVAFYLGREVVRIAGSFGPSASPPRLKELADTLVVRMFQAKQTGQSDVVGQDQMGRAVVSRFVSRRDYDTLDQARYDWLGTAALFA